MHDGTASSCNRAIIFLENLNHANHVLAVHGECHGEMCNSHAAAQVRGKFFNATCSMLKISGFIDICVLVVPATLRRHSVFFLMLSNYLAICLTER
jgi:hypothetical protein